VSKPTSKRSSRKPSVTSAPESDDGDEPEPTPRPSAKAPARKGRRVVADSDESDGETPRPQAAEPAESEEDVKPPKPSKSASMSDEEEDFVTALGSRPSSTKEEAPSTPKAQVRALDDASPESSPDIPATVLPPKTPGRTVPPRVSVMATPAPPPPAGPKPRLTIHKLVLNNFKSYGGRQEIGPFHKSFSAIVGPNGSGKSNTIDALLFVFGFRATKMRQGKLSELIHNSAGHENINACSVEVHFREIVDLVSSRLPTSADISPVSTTSSSSPSPRLSSRVPRSRTTRPSTRSTAPTAGARRSSRCSRARASTSTTTASSSSRARSSRSRS
jgi:structural maintenance of chromosome 4